MNLDDSSLPPDDPQPLNRGTPTAAGKRQQPRTGRMQKTGTKAPAASAPQKSKAPTTSAKQSAAARRNIKKAATAAKKKRTISKLPKKTRTALGKEGAKAARKNRR